MAPRPELDRFDRELEDLPPEVRWREWMGRVEAVIFASPEPVGRETLSLLVGQGCNLDLLIADIQEELRQRPYELVPVAGGWQHRTRPSFKKAIRAGLDQAVEGPDLSEYEAAVLAAIAWHQPITRRSIGEIFGKEVSRDLIARLRASKLIGPGPRSPQPGSPYTYVTTAGFLSYFGLNSLSDLPDMEMLQEAGLDADRQPNAAAIGMPIAASS